MEYAALSSVNHHLPKGWVFIAPSKVEPRMRRKTGRDARAIVSRLCIIHFISNFVNITAPKGAGECSHFPQLKKP